MLLDGLTVFCSHLTEPFAAAPNTSSALVAASDKANKRRRTQMVATVDHNTVTMRDLLHMNPTDNPTKAGCVCQLQHTAGMQSDMEPFLFNRMKPCGGNEQRSGKS